MSLNSLAPGVTPSSDRVFNAEQAARKALDLAKKAVASDTFGVGGYLMDKSGRVFADAINAVIRKGEVQDPTAHVERQLVDWYFDARAHGFDVPASELVIVSSLDPCAMCAGAILSAGLNVISLATDYFSGVHVEGFPHRIPQELWNRAEASFGLFKVSGQSRVADRISPILSGDTPIGLFNASEMAFQQSLERTRNLVSGSKAHLSELSRSSAINSPEIMARLNVLLGQITDTAFFPEERLGLKDLVSMRGTSLLSQDQVVIVDNTGTILLAAKGEERLSPARSSVLELIRAYVQIRKLAKTQLNFSFPHQRYCSLIKHRAPDAPEKMLMELGALGSFFEDVHLGRNTPSLMFLDSARQYDAERWAASLPPFYRSIKITVGHAEAVHEIS